jgi:hypothetical protein
MRFPEATMNKLEQAIQVRQVVHSRRWRVARKPHKEKRRSGRAAPALFWIATAADQRFAN